jgi:hypothetical protein
MPHFRTARSPKRGNKHSVVIDKPEASRGTNNHIAVLQITVSDTKVTKIARQFPPLPGKIQQNICVSEISSNKHVQRFTLTPFHLHDRIPLTSHANTLPNVFKSQ